MAYVSVRELLKKSDKGERVHSNEDVCISVNKCGAPDKDVWALVVSISTSIAKKARFMLGDKVELLFDPEKRIGLLKRTNDGGWSLTSGGKDIKSRMYFKIQFVVGMPSVKQNTGCPSEVTPEGIEFIFPDEVSFTENLRGRK